MLKAPGCLVCLQRVPSFHASPEQTPMKCVFCYGPWQGCQPCRLKIQHGISVMWPVRLCKMRKEFHRGGDTRDHISALWEDCVSESVKLWHSNLSSEWLIWGPVNYPCWKPTCIFSRWHELSSGEQQWLSWDFSGLEPSRIIPACLEIYLPLSFQKPCGACMWETWSQHDIPGR